MFYNDKVLLMILDGWGHSPNPKVSAIDQANKPFMDSLYKKYPNSELVTFGKMVGLPEGQMGNSEVGHLNIGAGRIVYQELERINKAIETFELNNNSELLTAIDYALKNKKNVHLLGLVSDGGVHSHINHLKALIAILQTKQVPNIYIHAITDGRDTDPKSGINFLKDLQNFIENSNAVIATVCGRYYTMDRDNRWERIEKAYNLLVNGKGIAAKNALTALKEQYNNGTSDEFILPICIVNEQNKPLATILSNDLVICFNFRTDRCREITSVLTQQSVKEWNMKPLLLYFVTMTEYDHKFTNIKVLFDNDNLINTLGEVLAKADKTQVRAAETEKYPHVTFFFSGGQEEPFKGEERILVPSPKVATYDLQPEMSANELCKAILPVIKNKQTNFICVNFANADMVGHTGVFSAAVKAIETLDNCVEQIVNASIKNNYTCIITADHGNADKMINDDGTPNTAHTVNPVPIIIVDNNYTGNIKNGKLADIAPTILSILNIAIPIEMTGNILIDN